MRPEVAENRRVMVTHLTLGLSLEGLRTLVPSSLHEWQCRRQPHYLGIMDSRGPNSHCPVQVHSERL